MNENFEKESIEIIIEKAGLDSIATKETPEVPQILKKAYQQIYYVLKPKGIVLSFSIKNQEFWNTSVFNYLRQEGMFEVVDQKRTVFTSEKNPTYMNLYFYYLKKI